MKAQLCKENILHLYKYVLFLKIPLTPKICKVHYTSISSAQLDNK